MAEKNIYNGNPTFLTGSSTPFKFYNTDLNFVTDAPKCADYCARKLGYPVLDVELEDENFFTAFEEAVTTYGDRVHQSLIVQNYLSLEGSTSTEPLNGKLIVPNLYPIVNLAEQYGTEAVIGGRVTKYTGQVPLQAGVQEYDLEQWSVDNGISGSIEVRKVFYENTPAVLRYYDPYVGSGTGMQSLIGSYGISAMSPGMTFLLLPTSYDVLKTQAIEFNDQVRRAAHSFEIVNNRLKIFPIPKSNFPLIIEYYKDEDKANAGIITPASGSQPVTNISEVQYTNPVYTNINAIGRIWIYKYAAALCKEVLAYIRGKYTTVQIPGAETTMNQADLLADARDEKRQLLEELDDFLERTSRVSQLEARSKESEFTQDTLTHVPMQIYVG